MAKLVVLSEEFKGRTYELKVDKTTVGRLEDNAFQIAEASISSHHCEILLKGDDVVIKDLESTNGTFVDGEKISESVLKPGQVLKLGQVELRLQNGEGALTPAKAGDESKPGKGPEKAMPQGGIRKNELETGTRPVNFDANSPFKKQSNKINKIFIGIGIGLALIIVAFLLIALKNMQR